MPRGIKATAETVVTEETTSTVDISAFKQAIIEVGIKLCDDVKDGRAKSPAESLEAISSLYNAIK